MLTRKGGQEITKHVKVQLRAKKSYNFSILRRFVNTASIRGIDKKN